jgi:hypothetical protein
VEGFQVTEGRRVPPPPPKQLACFLAHDLSG